MQQDDDNINKFYCYSYSCCCCCLASLYFILFQVVIFFFRMSMFVLGRLAIGFFIFCRARISFFFIPPCRLLPAIAFYFNGLLVSFLSLLSQLLENNKKKETWILSISHFNNKRFICI